MWTIGSHHPAAGRHGRSRRNREVLGSSFERERSTVRSEHSVKPVERTQAVSRQSTHPTPAAPSHRPAYRADLLLISAGSAAIPDGIVRVRDRELFGHK